MKKAIKKLIKNNNVELKADIKEVKKQYKKVIKALDNKYSKQIENIKAENKRTIVGQDTQEETTEIKYNIDIVEKDLEAQNDTNNLKATEVKPITNKKTIHEDKKHI